MPARYLTVSLLLYLLSLCFDGAKMTNGGHMPALQMLLYGAWGVPFGLFQWFANPLLALAMLCRRRFRRLALVLGLSALYLVCGTFGIERLPDNRSYAFHDVTALGAGFWLWLVAILVFCAGQGWWCWQARQAAEMPRWRLLDGLLLVILGCALYAATQMPSLRFEPGKALMPPVYHQQPRVT
ncbi:hypothetical protein PS627_04180 [Pseudomonas fluorescens]|uniref:hypothetical protein n=1 Tax=Pseudomonas fluorescens TaxID=294 RepID=UPI001259D56D|nr:hypothetical protein [Pseudomonas fluorescens]CAG8870860.1 hypothetical protein PS627_04180 [Pseudomonas fluorescens]